jgi:hypothetical protein
VPPSFISSVNVSDYLFLGNTSQTQANNTQGILCLEEGHLLVGRSWKRTVYGDYHVYTQVILEELRPNPEHISFWNNTRKQQTKFSQ